MTGRSFWMCFDQQTIMITIIMDRNKMKGITGFLPFGPEPLFGSAVKRHQA